MTAPGQSDSVVADDTSITKLGQTMVGWSQDVDRLAASIRNTKITPGHVEHAADLRDRYNARFHEDYVTVLDNLRKSLYAMGTELVAMAKVYAKTENLNTDDLARLDGLVRSVGKVYPDFRPGGADSVTSILQQLTKG